jgi:hypothetical protein
MFVRLDAARSIEKTISTIMRHRDPSNDYASIGAIHYVIGNDPPAEVYVFYQTNADLAEARRTGATERFPVRFMRELATFYSHRPDRLVSKFEFDSHENVCEHYRGSYFLRLR